MSGPEGAHGNTGGFDLLRRATQAMMSKTASTEDDNSSDQLGFETPRSGIATPQPDLQDKRLPGIASYFGQVRLDSPDEHECSLVSPRPARTSTTSEPIEPSTSRNKCCETSKVVRLPQGVPQIVIDNAKTPFPYPTPPTSQSSSSGTSSIRNERTEEGARSLVSLSTTPSLFAGGSGGPSTPDTNGPTITSLAPEAAAIAAAAVATATPPHEVRADESLRGLLETPDPSAHQIRGNWFSVETLKQLTRDALFKSGPPTPTRALSSARPSTNDVISSSKRLSQDGIDTSGSSAVRASTGVQAPAPKGKLTIKIAEGKGIRRSKDPYVVVVFQRNELISGGPRMDETVDEGLPASSSNTSVPMARQASIPMTRQTSIPMQRQASESSRTPMAIPMRSRQSSNTSNADYGSFRNKISNRVSFTNPKWDAEAIFDVVESDMLVEISVYDHNPTGEEFLGHLDFRATRDKETPVSGWFPLRGRADTMVENTPTGEIYVEALYQLSERKHFGPKDFEILKLIGKGTFGQVYQVRKRDTRRIYAMKVLQKKVIVQKKEVAHTVGERNILVRTAMSDSPFIVGLKFSFQTPSELYLVTDYMSGGELFWHLQKEGRFNEKRAKFYIAELILAIQHLHRSDIVYRDLKPENILLDANGHIALCDFGLSKANLTKNDTTNTFCGTTEYLAPEVLLDESGYTKMVDFWSLGVLVFEMCCGWSPFYAEDTQQMYKNIAFGKVRFPRDTLSQEGRNFVKSLLNRNPKHRLGATSDTEELKQHAFFNDINWDTLAKKLISPPFKPKLKSETDVSYFDPEFTNALDQNGSLNERAAALARGYATSTPLSPSVQANFHGFTYVDESTFEDHMQNKAISDDENMDDAHASHDEEDWDNLDDIDLRKANRMSGIVRTSGHDEQMVGNSHFEM